MTGPGRPHGESVDELATEARLPAARDLDLLATVDQVALVISENQRALVAVADALPQLATAVEVVTGCMARGGRLIYIGAGTSGRLGVLDAAEVGPTFSVPDRVRAVMAGGMEAVVAPVEYNEDDTAAGRRDLAALAPTVTDVVVAVSASGRTPYALAALEHARGLGATTIAVVNNPGSPMAAAADVAVELLTGPEVVAGSTRMKAGTAQKVVLNVLSTLPMVALGHTHGDLMADVRATNAKLVARAARIVAEATGAERHDVDVALAAADGEAKVAIVMLLAGIDAAAARTRLENADGRVRDALAPDGHP